MKDVMVKKAKELSTWTFSIVLREIRIYTHTHTHTHIYIYIYIYIWEKSRKVDKPTTNRGFSNDISSLF